MRKSDLIGEIAQRTGNERAQVEAVIEALMTSIKNTVIEKKKVSLRSFGTFSLKRRKAKMARNIVKNIPILIPERNIPWFKPARTFMKRVKNQPDKAK